MADTQPEIDSEYNKKQRSQELGIQGEEEMIKKDIEETQNEIEKELPEKKKWVEMLPKEKEKKKKNGTTSKHEEGKIQMVTEPVTQENLVKKNGCT